MTEPVVPKEVMSAIEQFTAKVTVPVLYDDPEAALDQVGTGTLFEIDHRLFLVTAAHLFEGVNPSNFSIPNPLTTKLSTLGPYTIYSGPRKRTSILPFWSFCRDPSLHMQRLDGVPSR
jgi:hypothetical protein